MCVRQPNPVSFCGYRGDYGKCSPELGDPSAKTGTTVMVKVRVPYAFVKRPATGTFYCPF